MNRNNRKVYKLRFSKISMAKTLNKMLGIGAIAATAMFGGVKDAKANIIYDYGLQTNKTQLASGGYLGVVSHQTIEDLGDSYKSTTSLQNTSQDNVGGGIPASYFKMNINADLAGLGATDIVEEWMGWQYETTGANSGSMVTNDSNDYLMSPGYPSTFSYTIKKDIDGDGIIDVIGFENVGASMQAPAGEVQIGYQAPIPEPTTLGLVGLFGAGLYLARRFFNPRAA
ncbi:MAG: PEP-CTERM sorting domain-containing protein [Kiritimatiellales bacterium]|nr:PEP-CTERM sorting domain-containing protein [Kiritimatiellales bacterium]